MLEFSKLEKKFYDKTCDLPYFTTDDLRRFKLMKYFDTSNQIGAFFKYMSNRGDISAVDAVPSTHKEAKGRSVTAWEWEIMYAEKST